MDDDEPTPRPTPSETRPATAAIQARSTGDFRTHETTLWTLAFDDIYEVRLASDSGDAAHFAVDAQLAPRLAAELERQLSTPYYRHLFLGQGLSSPRRARLGEPGTQIFFAAADLPRLGVARERGGDRVVLTLLDAEASLHITLQAAVAFALYEFFATIGKNT